MRGELGGSAEGDVMQDCRGQTGTRMLLHLLLVGLAAAAARPMAGQVIESPTDDFRIELGMMLGAGLPSAYFAPECSDGVGLGGFASLVKPVNHWLDLSLDAQYQWDSGVGNCAVAQPAIPAPYTSREVVSEGSSTWAPMISIRAGPPLSGGVLMVRGVARLGIRSGLEREFLFVLGGEAKFGEEGALQLVLGFDHWFTDVKVRRTLLQEEGGEVVRQETTVSDESGDFGAVRIGLSVPVW